MWLCNLLEQIKEHLNAESVSVKDASGDGRHVRQVHTFTIWPCWVKIDSFPWNKCYYSQITRKLLPRSSNYWLTVEMWDIFPVGFNILTKTTDPFLIYILCMVRMPQYCLLELVIAFSSRFTCMPFFEWSFYESKHLGFIPIVYIGFHYTIRFCLVVLLVGSIKCAFWAMKTLTIIFFFGLVIKYFFVVRRAFKMPETHKQINP